MPSRPTPAFVAARAWFVLPALALAALLTLLILGEYNLPWFRMINGWSPTPLTDRAWAGLTILSDGVVTAVLMFPWIRRNPERIWATILAGLIFTVASVVLKQTADLDRPPGLLADLRVIGPAYKHHSFPSGHAAMITALACVWAWTSRSIGVRLGLLALAALVSLSRVVVGVHWPLDIVVGALLGLLGARAAIPLAARWTWGASAAARPLMAFLMMLCCIVIFFPYTQMHLVIWEQRLLAVACFSAGVLEYRRWRVGQKEERRP